MQVIVAQELAHVHNVATGDEVGQQAGLGEVGNVGGVASVYADGDAGLELFAADVLNVNASGGLESGYGGVEFGGIGIGEGAVYDDDFARKFASVGAG